jgi:hypothetical protein
MIPPRFSPSSCARIAPSSRSLTRDFPDA